MLTKTNKQRKPRKWKCNKQISQTQNNLNEPHIKLDVSQINDILFCHDTDKNQLYIIDRENVWYYFDNYSYKHGCYRHDRFNSSRNGWVTICNDRIIEKNYTFTSVICEHNVNYERIEDYTTIPQYRITGNIAASVKAIKSNIYPFCNESRSYEHISDRFGKQVADKWNKILLSRCMCIGEIPIKNYEPFTVISSDLLDLLSNYITYDHFTSEIECDSVPTASMRLVCKIFNDTLRPKMYLRFKNRMINCGKSAQVPCLDGTDHISILPLEIISKIMSFISVGNLAITAVSKHIRKVSLVSQFTCMNCDSLVSLLDVDQTHDVENDYDFIEKRVLCLSKCDCYYDYYDDDYDPCHSSDYDD